MEVTPILVTSIAWESFIGECQEHLGISPTRGLDDTGISPQDVKAMIASINMRNDPKEALSLDGATTAWSQIYFGFIARARKATVAYLSCHSKLNITYRNVVDEDTSDYLFVASGSLLDWYIATTHCFRVGAPRQVKEYFDQILKAFERAGLQDIWKHRKRVSTAEGFQVFF